jgi:hypothetical protein
MRRSMLVLVLSLAVTGCAGKLQMTYFSDPPGAMLWIGPQILGPAPQTVTGIALLLRPVLPSRPCFSCAPVLLPRSRCLDPLRRELGSCGPLHARRGAGGVHGVG